MPEAIKKELQIKNIIVSTHDSLYPIKGGGALRTLKTAEEFRNRGFNVIIIAPTEQPTTYLNGIKIHWLHPPRKQRSQILSSLKFNIRLLRKFLQCIGSVDTIFVHNTIAAATIPFLKKFFRFKFAIDIGDIHAEYLHIGNRNLFEKLLTPPLLKIEYWIINSADTISVLTEEMKKLLIKRGIKKGIRVVYDGAEVDNFSTIKDIDSLFNVIHFGMIDRQHGVEILIQAIPRVIQKYPEAKFFIVGGGRELPNVKRLAQKLDVFKNCIFTDYLPYPEAREYLKKVSIGIIPRDDYLANRIVISLKLCEYWASRTAVISSRLKGIEEIAEDGRDIIFFEPGNSKDLADKILYLLADPERIAKLRAGGLSTIKNFDWHDVIPKIVDFALQL